MFLYSLTADGTLDIRQHGWCNAVAVAEVSQFSMGESLQKSCAAQTKLVDVPRLGWIDARRVAVPSDSRPRPDPNNRSVDPRIGGAAAVTEGRMESCAVNM